MSKEYTVSLAQVESLQSLLSCNSISGALIIMLEDGQIGTDARELAEVWVQMAEEIKAGRDKVKEFKESSNRFMTEKEWETMKSIARGERGLFHL